MPGLLLPGQKVPPFVFLLAAMVDESVGDDVTVAVPHDELDEMPGRLADVGVVHQPLSREGLPPAAAAARVVFDRHRPGVEEVPVVDLQHHLARGSWLVRGPVHTPAADQDPLAGHEDLEVLVPRHSQLLVGYEQLAYTCINL